MHFKYGARLEITSFHAEGLPILRVAVENFEDRFGQAHAEEREVDLRVSVDLAKLEECACNLSRILQTQRRHNQQCP